MLKAIILILELLIIPFFLGVVIIPKKDSVLRYVTGFTFTLALFFLMYFLAIFFSMRLSGLSILFDIVALTIIVLFFLINFLYNRKKGKKYSIIAEIKSDEFSELKNNFKAESIFVKVIFVISVSFILFQAVRMIFVSPYIDGDDTTYATLTQSMASMNSIYTIGQDGNGIFDIYSIDKKYQVSSYYPFLASIAEISGIHSLILLKTILPVLFILISYLTAWLYAKMFFKYDLEKKSLFMLFLAVINEFSFLSYYSYGRRVLLWTWNSKSVCFTIILPFLMYLTLNYFLSYKNEKEDISFSLYFFLIFITNMACASITLMGTVLGAIMLFVLALSNLIMRRKLLPEILLIFTMLPYFINVLFIMTWR